MDSAILAKGSPCTRSKAEKAFLRIFARVLVLASFVAHLDCFLINLERFFPITLDNLSIIVRFF